jgi:anti-sigma regulatory factor (Ser/Thr protein kinase)
MGAGVDLPNDECAPADARAFVVAVARDHLAEQRVDDLALLVSELVTNVVRWARTTSVLRVELHDESVHVELTDFCAQLPQHRDTAGAHGGFGLRLLDQLASSWGTRPFDGGKTVWFDL